jgi:hypothetical protein
MGCQGIFEKYCYQDSFTGLAGKFQCASSLGMIPSEKERNMPLQLLDLIVLLIPQMRRHLGIHGSSFFAYLNANFNIHLSL